MRYLVTGGAGFIGSHLAEKLLENEHEVIVIDDLSTGSFENIVHLKGNPCFTYHIDTIFNKPLMDELVDMVDVIYHLAATVGVKLVVENPIRSIQTNVRGTDIVLDLAAKKKRTVVLASTSEVYGKSNELPFFEEHDLVLGSTSHARWSYACSKAVGEFLAIAYWRKEKVPSIILRFFNVVGPRQTGRYGMVIPRFVQQALKGEPITVYGNGEQTRTFTWVKDAVDAMVKIAQFPEAFGEIFNVGHYRVISILDLAKMVKQLTESSSPIVFVPYEKVYGKGFEDVPSRAPDLSKITNIIGYRPTLDLPQVLEEVIAHYSGTPTITYANR